MSTTTPLNTAAPDLAFAVSGAAPAPAAATPTILLRVQVRRRAGAPVRAATLGVRVDIAPAQRGYAPGEEERLGELFGAPEQWERTLTTLQWARATVLAGAFEDTTTVEVPLPGSCDFDVAAAKYLHALGEQGEIPLELMFSGTVLYQENGCVRAAPIPWDREASWRLPVSTWREAMRRAFGDSAWLRVSRETFEQLWAYRRRVGAPDWERTIASLLVPEPQR